MCRENGACPQAQRTPYVHARCKPSAYQQHWVSIVPHSILQGSSLSARMPYAGGCTRLSSFFYLHSAQIAVCTKYRGRYSGLTLPQKAPYTVRSVQAEAHMKVATSQTQPKPKSKWSCKQCVLGQMSRSQGSHVCVQEDNDLGSYVQAQPTINH